ncbi:ATP-binding protein [Aliiroseovarius sp. KMU-50]|uniref:histidine kinase n=1 Tax=Aliiroseovarius salicola TaxID=3009082 RepID=A0ABT4W074_9RHOB|nr:ATP-binding protein [Aliiroseovarius sp. KMU-50]MDA5093913.1 ATP-binding protein [Aliiroseovarius sp. KMU-50]
MAGPTDARSLNRVVNPGASFYAPLMVKSLRSKWVLAFIILVAAFSAGVWALSWQSALKGLEERGRTDLTLASDRLTRHLLRYRELAVLLAEHPDLVALLKGQGVAREATALLRSTADKTGAQSITLVDRDGRILAVSETSPDLRNPEQEPVYRALTGALGATNTTRVAENGLTRRLFTFAAPVYTGRGRAQGAVVAEVDIWLFEQNWPTTATAIYFVNDRGQVFVTNRSELVLTDRFGDEGFPSHNLQRWFGHDVWTLDGGPYLPGQALHLAVDLPVIGLTGEILLDTAPAIRVATMQAAVAAAVFLVFGAALLVLAERRRALSERLAVEAAANARLEARVAQRTQALSEANDELRQAQADLVQAGKLSALGQMSAGISHELNQPLMAIRSFADNGTEFLKRGNAEKAGTNLDRISELAGRMDRIIKNLRAFARNESEPLGKVDIVQVIDASVELSNSRLRADGVSLDWTPPPHPVFARGGEVRLGQVFVNLINNAADAMVGQDEKHIAIDLVEDGRIAVSVRDSGPGIADPDKIFEPFYSTKQVGDEGMGLGLSISYGLVQSFGGDIRGRNANGGAVFTVELEYWSEEEGK